MEIEVGTYKCSCRHSVGLDTRTDNLLKYIIILWLKTLWWVLYSEDVIRSFLRNVGKFMQVYVVSYCISQ